MADRNAQSNRRTHSGTDAQRQIELFPVDGSVVYQAEPLERDLEHQEELRRRRQAWEEQEKAERAARVARRNRAREMRMNRLYAAFLSVCVIGIFGICVLYLNLQNQASDYKDQIVALQTQVNELEADNEEMLQNIETSVDLSEILEKATSELGMTYPDADQIVTYEADTSDTLTQYADVSSSSGSSVFSGIFGN